EHRFVQPHVRAGLLEDVPAHAEPRVEADPLAEAHGMRERGAHAPRGLALVPPVAVDRVDQEAGEVLEELETSVADVHRALQLVSVLAERVRQRGEDSTGAPAWR